jgi:hypothetical protein
MYEVYTVKGLLNLLGKRVRLRSGEVVRIPEDGEWRFYTCMEHQAYVTTGGRYVAVATSPYWDEEDVASDDVLEVLPKEPDEDNLKEWELAGEPEVYVCCHKGYLIRLLDVLYGLGAPR